MFWAEFAIWKLDQFSNGPTIWKPNLQKFGIQLFGIQMFTVQYASESRMIRHSNGQLSDTFCVRLSNGKNKMAETIW
jgi:hypothetical protein